jgi:RNA polymerase sigma-70 factor (ECF subfamily)
MRAEVFPVMNAVAYPAPTLFPGLRRMAFPFVFGPAARPRKPDAPGALAGGSPEAPVPEAVVPVRAEVRELMERIVRRDERALELLYDRFSKTLYAAVVCIVKSREDAEEILCEVFHQVWERAAQYDAARGAVYTWLLRMARNRAIDKIRSKDHKNSRLDADHDGEMDGFEAGQALSALDGIVLSERAAVVKEALAEISPEQRHVLEAAYFEGYTQSQIAARAGLPLGTVKTRMRDGMKVLQNRLKGRMEWP